MPLKLNKSFLGRQVILPVRVSVYVKIKLDALDRLEANLSSCCVEQANGVFLLMQDPYSCYEKKVKKLYLWYNCQLLWEISCSHILVPVLCGFLED